MRLGEGNLQKKRILILSEGFGSGHTQAAHALAVSLRQFHSGIQPRVLELGTFLHPTLAPWILNAYRKTVSTKPNLYGKLYRFQYKKTLHPLTQMALHRIFYRNTDEVIRHLRPDVIVCTHPFPNLVVSRLKRAGLATPLCTVITDYDAHGTWVSQEVNRYLVSTTDVKNKLLSRGIDPNKIEITGIPIHPSFWQRQDKEEIRRQFRLKLMPTVLVMGGGWGLFDQQHVFIDDIIRWRDRIQFIFCLGRNEKALAELAEDPRFQHEHVHLFGYTKDVHKLMEVSHLLLTKPGGITCTEGLAKGIPMLFYKPIPGQEEENMQYFTEHGYGEQIISSQTINNRFRLLVQDFEECRLSDMERPARSIDGASQVPPVQYAKAIMELLNMEAY